MKLKSKSSSYIYEVLFSNQDGYLLKGNETTGTFWTNSADNYEEYKEPRSAETRWVAVFDLGRKLQIGTELHSTEESCKSARWYDHVTSETCKAVKTISVNYTEEV